MTILPSSATIYIYIYIFMNSKSLPHGCLVQKFHRENGVVFNPRGRGKSTEKKNQLHGVPRCWVGGFLVLQAPGGWG